MSTSEMVLYILCILLYTVFAVFTIRNFKSLAGGIVGTGCLLAGGVGIYYIVPTLLSLLVGAAKLFLGLLLIGGFISALFDN